MPEDHALAVVLDGTGAIAAARTIEGIVWAITRVDGGVAVLVTGADLRPTVVTLSLDLTSLSSTPLALARFYSGQYPTDTAIAVLPDGDILTALGCFASGPVTFDDGSTHEGVAEPNGGALLRTDASGRPRWMLTLPNTAYLSDLAHLQGAALSPDGTRMTACGLTQGGAIVDERAQAPIATFSVSGEHAYCVEVNTSDGTIRTLRETALEPTYLSGVSYFGDEAIALFTSSAGAGPRLLRVSDGATTSELFAGDTSGAKAVGRVIVDATTVTVTLFAPAGADFSPVVPGFVVPGVAGDRAGVLLHLELDALSW